MRHRRRLRSNRVPPEHIHFTGFPLPDELTGGRSLGTLKSSLTARLSRLDPAGTFFEGQRREVESTVSHPPAAQRGRPPLLVFAIGGAGAQADGARPLLAVLAPELRRETLRLALVAGVRSDVAARFRKAVAGLDLSDLPPSTLRVFHEPDFASHYRAFNTLLAEADVLVTKPSELAFFAALGVPLLLTDPIGRHEAVNRRWVVGRCADSTCRRRPISSGGCSTTSPTGALPRRRGAVTARRRDGGRSGSRRSRRRPPPAKLHHRWSRRERVLVELEFEIVDRETTRLGDLELARCRTSDGVTGYEIRIDGALLCQAPAAVTTR